MPHRNSVRQANLKRIKDIVKQLMALNAIIENDDTRLLLEELTRITKNKRPGRAMKYLG